MHTLQRQVLQSQIIFKEWECVRCHKKLRSKDSWTILQDSMENFIVSSPNWGVQSFNWKGGLPVCICDWKRQLGLAVS